MLYIFLGIVHVNNHINILLLQLIYYCLMLIQYTYIDKICGRMHVLALANLANMHARTGFQIN